VAKGDEIELEDCGAPDDAPEPRHQDAGVPLDGKLADAGNAERLAALFGDELRHVFATNTWLAWCGTHWGADDLGTVWQRAVSVARSWYTDAQNASDEKVAKAIAKHATRSLRAASLAGMIQVARSHPRLVAKREHLDADPWLLNCTNGTLDLKSGTLRPHRREDFITRCAPVAYNPDAPRSRWLRFLAEALPDESVRAYLRRYVGSALVGAVLDHVLLVLWGELGRNGKGTFTNAIKAALGAYYAQAPRDLLMVARGERHSTGQTMLEGARFVVASETAAGATLDAALVKMLCGGDPVTARGMRENNHTWTPTHHLCLVTNPKPRVPHDDPAVWARIHLVPWTISFAGREDPKLGETLATEAPGILAWAVEGCREWQRAGLAPPDAVKHATETYREEQDPLGEFFAVCTFDRSVKVSRKSLFEFYQRTARAWGIERTMSATGFARAVTARLRASHGSDFATASTMRETRPGEKASEPVRAWCGVTFNGAPKDAQAELPS
jgi:putative DNA primase/helicase